MKVSLYNIRTLPGGSYRVAKFDEDIDVLAVYVVTKPGRYYNCNCRAGQRPSCRHREMVIGFLKYNAVDTGLLYDYDNQKWKRL